VIRKITEQHRKEAGELVYKVVRDKKGELMSLFVNGTRECPDIFDWESGENKKAITLTYKEDRVISNGKLGIWCCTTLGGARWQAKHNGGGKLCQIYRVKPLGEPSFNYGTYGNDTTVLYPSIIMDKHIETVDNRVGINSGWE